MSDQDINETIKQFTKIRIKNSKRPKSISFKKFRGKRPDWNVFPDTQEPFFQDSKEVALYSKNKLFTGENRWNESKVPVLNDDIAQLAEKTKILDCKPLIKPYMEHDLFKDYNGTIPLMSEDELNTPGPCFEYISDWEAKYLQDNKKYGQNYKYVIISARHHINNLAITLFDVKRPINFKLNCILLKGKYIVLSMDEKSKSNNMDLSKLSLTDKKRCNSGFAFEHLLTGTKAGDNSEPVFSIIENVFNSDVLLLLRSEMDAYNNKTKSYSELKCYGPLSMGNTYHRLKLLKTWVQTQLVPDCDVIIGTRQNYGGLLTDIQEFTREQFYKKLNIRDSALSRNFNLTVARAWTRHCIESIVKLVDLSVDKNEEYVIKPQPFQLSIDDMRNISIKKLDHIPTNIDIPKQYL
ncbi:decapping and exoribonuclease protein 1 [Monosporozyma unispora]|nr:Dxo1p [Kazachstania unispora]